MVLQKRSKMSILTIFIIHTFLSILTFSDIVDLFLLQTLFYIHEDKNCQKCSKLHMSKIVYYLFLSCRFGTWFWTLWVSIPLYRSGLIMIWSSTIIFLLRCLKTITKEWFQATWTFSGLVKFRFIAQLHNFLLRILKLTSVVCF